MAEDAVKVAPHVYKIAFENDRVRVLDTRMRPGDKTEMHSHPAVVVCPIIDGKYKFTSPNGESMEIGVEAGESMYMDGMDHATGNVGTTEGRVLLIELK